MDEFLLDVVKLLANKDAAGCIGGWPYKYGGEIESELPFEASLSRSDKGGSCDDDVKENLFWFT